MKKKKIVKLVVLLIVIVLAGGLLVKNNAKPVEYRTFTAIKSNIESIISGSGTIGASKSKKEYAKVSAEITDIFFKEGDEVKSGDVIMKLDSETFKNTIDSQKIAIEQSKLSRETIEKQIRDLKVVANASGYVRGLSVSEGTYAATTTPICDIVKNGAYEIVLQFVHSETKPINVGDDVTLTLLGSYTTTEGTVTKVSDMRMAAAGNVQVKEVTVEVPTTGYALEGTSAKALVHGVANLESFNSGTFKVVKLNTVRTKTTGTVKSVLVNEGSYVNAGDVIAILENADLTTNLKNINLSLETQYNQLKNSNSQLENYEVVSTIDGTLTALPFEEGDLVAQGTLIASISNKDKMEFKIPVDELDVAKLNYDQLVEVSIDAIPETKYNPLKGRITLIPLEGTTTAGITDYYVTIEIDDTDDIRISMSANADIIVNRLEDVLCVPIDAVKTDDKSGKSFVDVLTVNAEGIQNVETKEVQTGASDTTYIEVISGIKEGDKVVIPTANSLYMPSAESMR